MQSPKPLEPPSAASQAAGGGLDFSAVHNNLDLYDALQALNGELARASQSGSLAPDLEARASSFVTQALAEVRMPVPNRTTVLEHLDDAKSCLAESPSAEAFVQALSQAAERVEALF